MAERFRALGHAGELRVDRRRAGQLRRRGSEQLRRATAPVLGCDRLGAPERGTPQRLQMPQPVSLNCQLRSLILARRDALDLVELERQQVELALTPGGELVHVRKALLELSYPAVCIGHALPEPTLQQPAVTVEDVKLDGREHQLAVLVLAVEGQQRAP